MGRMQGLVRDLIGRPTKHTDSAILGLVLVRVGNLMGEVGNFFFRLLQVALPCNSDKRSSSPKNGSHSFHGLDFKHHHLLW